jgi:GT2 family glycosyltransferase
LSRAEWKAFSFEVIYVDNGSTDDTLTMISGSFPKAKVIANEENLGFCKAANQGARIANSRYYCFLNDDTVVLDDAVARLADFLDQTPQAGAVGARLLYPDMSEQWSGRRFPTPLNAILGRQSWLARVFPNARPLVDYLYKEKTQDSVPFTVDWVSAAAVMARKETFWSIGGFAEDYYYWHEAVFCDRIWQAGSEIYLVPLSRVIHFEGKGSGARPYSVRRWHVLNFHEGAYRCYCERYRLGKWSARRWFAAVGLRCRAVLLLSAIRIQSLLRVGAH